MHLMQIQQSMAPPIDPNSKDNGANPRDIIMKHP